MSADDGVYVSLSIPCGQQPHAELQRPLAMTTITAIRSAITSGIDDRTTFQINAGRADNGATSDGYYRHR